MRSKNRLYFQSYFKIIFLTKQVELFTFPVGPPTDPAIAI